MKRGRLTCLAALAGWLLAPLCGAQILVNGGFEQGLKGWTTTVTGGASATFANNTGNIHGGTNAVLVTVPYHGPASNSVQLVAGAFAADPADTYVLRFWASAYPNYAPLAVNLIGASPAFPQIPFQISTNDNGYQEYLYAFRASGNVSVAFSFQGNASYWLDDVEVLDLANNDGWDIPMAYMWQWGQLQYSKTNSVGWGGGDNDKSVLLPDGSVAWIFNDTWTETLNSFYSNIHGGGSMPRNSVVHQVGTNLYWMNKGTVTFFVPTNSTNLYWIGDCLVENNKVLVLLSEINATSITRVGTAIGQLSLPSLSLDSITTVSSPGADDYNQVVNGNDGYYYIYWKAAPNDVRVARTPVGSLAVSSAWTYWNGSSWVADHTKSTTLPNLAEPWSFAQLGPSNYAAVYIPDLSVTITAQFAPSPMGPWSFPVPVYETAFEWGELNYMPNICAGTGSNGVYTIGYSDNGSPDNLAKVAADKSYYNPHFIRANLWQLSPYSFVGGNGGPGARMSIKLAADQNWNHDAIDNRWGAGALNTTNWFNVYSSSAKTGATNVTFYTLNGQKYRSTSSVVYKFAAEINNILNNAQLTNNAALMNSFINVDNNCWYLSVTNLDAAFTNGYSVCFYYHGNNVGWGGQNYVKYYAGQTTNSPVRGIQQWNLYTTVTANDGRFLQDSTPGNAGTSGETSGANYCVFTNLSGGAFDLLITNGNYGGACAIEVVANPATTSCLLTSSQTNAPYGTAIALTNWLNPAPPDGENVMFMDGATLLGSSLLAGGVATCTASGLGAGTHPISVVYNGDGNYLASTSSVRNVTITPTLSAPVLVPDSKVYWGDNVMLICSNFGGGQPYVFQWQTSPDGNAFANLPGATTNWLGLASVTTNASGSYRLILSVNSLSVTSAVAQVTIHPLPVISSRCESGKLVMSWPDGTLLQSTNVRGPWTMNGSASPYTNDAASPQMFYRILAR